MQFDQIRGDGALGMAHCVTVPALIDWNSINSVAVNDDWSAAAASLRREFPSDPTRSDLSQLGAFSRS